MLAIIFRRHRAERGVTGGLVRMGCGSGQAVTGGAVAMRLRMVGMSMSGVLAHTRGGSRWRGERQRARHHNQTNDECRKATDHDHLKIRVVFPYAPATQQVKP